MPSRAKFRNHDFQISYQIPTLFDVFIFEDYY